MVALENKIGGTNHDDIQNEYPLIGTFIKKIREELDLTQKMFSEKVGIKQPTLSLIEKGEYSLKFNQILQISEGLGIAPLTFIMKMFDYIKMCPNYPTLKIEDYDAVVSETQELIKQKKKMFLEGQLELLK